MRPAAVLDMLGKAARSHRNIVTSPDDFASRYHVHKGNYEHADVVVSQLGPWRPVPSLAGYRTPIPGLYHSASGAFPMSFISGWPGRGTARMLLRRPSPLQRIRQRASKLRQSPPSVHD